MSGREQERAGIETFIRSCAAEHFAGKRVLDYGSGRQPYRAIVEEAGGEYTPYDAPSYPGSVAERDTTGETFGRTYDTILCTQVLQFVERPRLFLIELRGRFLRPTEGPVALVMTYTTHWPEIEPGDLYRYTARGMERMLTDAGFDIARHEPRHVLATTPDGEQLRSGYGVVATIPQYDGPVIVSAA